MPEIRVKNEEESKDSKIFSVKVIEGDSESSHRVTLKDEDFNRLSSEGASEQRLIEESFRFLLEREPKESILNSFDLTVISNYFPEYEEKIQKRLGN